MSWVSEAELLDMLGKDLTVSMLAHFGGQRLYVPRYPNVTHAISQTIGLYGMTILCAAYPSQMLTFPSPPDRLTAKKKILFLLDEGKTYGEIAWIARVGLRYVEMVAREKKKQEDQPVQGKLL